MDTTTTINTTLDPSPRSSQNPLTNEPINTSVAQLRVIKRQQAGKLAPAPVPYDESKIVNAMTKAFLAVEGGKAATSARIHEIVKRLTTQITDNLIRRHADGLVHIEDIQDQAELALMRASEHKIARAYVLYREERRRLREQRTQLIEANNTPRLKTISLEQMTLLVNEACQGLADVDPNTIIEETNRNLFEGASLADLRKALQLSARVMIEKEPNYSYVAARLLLDELRSEALSFLNLGEGASHQEMEKCYSNSNLLKIC